MNELYIVLSGGMYGHYGKGPRLEAAEKARRKSGGRKGDANRKVYRFLSALPFAPFDREATEAEADAWVGRDGSINWVRCKRWVLGKDGWEAAGPGSAENIADGESVA